MSSQSATEGFLPSVAGILCADISEASAIPQIAPAAWLKRVLKISFSPAISTIVCIMVMSFVPKYFDEKPGRAALLETTNLGTPNGSPFITSVPMRVPPAPPIHRTPSNFPNLKSSLHIFIPCCLIIKCYRRYGIIDDSYNDLYNMF